jgi:hypothetical protein
MLDGVGGLDEVLERVLQIVALVDHVRDVRHRSAAGIEQLQHDEEELEGCD